jgi:hypothetical protein
MSDYVAGFCCMQGADLVPFETTPITADNDDEAVQKAVEWRTTTPTTINRRTWLQVFRGGESKAFHTKEIARI